MTAAVSRSAVLGLYRSLIKNAREWQNYNFREYILRRVREDFAANRTETDPERLKSLISFAKENLEIVKRQKIVQNMYNQDKLVMEVKQKL